MVLARCYIGVGIIPLTRKHRRLLPSAIYQTFNKEPAAPKTQLCRRTHTRAVSTFAPFTLYAETSARPML